MKQELFLVQVWKCLEIVNYSGLTMILKVNDAYSGAIGFKIEKIKVL